MTNIDNMSLNSKRAVVVLSVILITLEGFNLSLPAPFFPEEAKKKGMNKSEIGLVTGCFDIANIMFGLVLARLLNPHRLKFVYCAGMIDSCITVSAFGLLSHIEDKNIFFLSCLLCRIVNGMGAAMVWSTILPVACSMFPEMSGRITAAVQVACGLGLVIGPPFGSALYGIGGYVFPFLVVAVTEAIFALVAILIVPQITSATSKTVDKNDIFNFMGTWGYFCLAFPMVALFCIPGMRDSCYSLHLINTLGLTEANVGYMFLCLSITFICVSALFGVFVDKGLGCYAAFFNVIFAPVGYFAFFIPYFFPVLENMPYTCLVLALNGAAIGGVMNPSYFLLEKLALSYGYTDRSHVKTMVATSFNLIGASGRMTGSLLLGGIINQHIGFYFTCLLFAGVLTACAVLYAQFLIKHGLLRVMYYEKYEETKPLISDSDYES